MLTRFDKTQERDRRTDGQMDSISTLISYVSIEC